MEGTTLKNSHAKNLKVIPKPTSYPDKNRADELLEIFFELRASFRISYNAIVDFFRRERRPPSVDDGQNTGFATYIATNDNLFSVWLASTSISTVHVDTIRLLR